jgi:glycosyltransferase involved in cell wall biosynthesis
MKTNSGGRKQIAIVATTAKMVNFFLISHITELSKEYDVTVICNFEKNERCLDHLPDNVEKCNISIKRNIDIFFDIGSLIFLIIFFYRRNFSITYSISPKGGLLCALSAWFVRVPVRIHTFTGQVWVTKKGIIKRLLRYLDFITSTLSTVVIVDSPSQRGFLEEQKVVKKNRALVIGHGSISGVNVKRFYLDKEVRKKVRIDMGVQESSIVFLFTGRLKKDKGVFDLVEAFYRVSSQISDSKLWLVGDDEENCESQISAYDFVKRCNIKFIKYTPSPETYIKAADVFCLPSYREGFGSTIIEAAFCGIPSIGSNIYGITDAIVNNKTGLIANVGDIDELTSKMLLMAQNSSLRKKMGDAAKNNALQKFDSSMITNELLLIIRKKVKESVL